MSDFFERISIRNFSIHKKDGFFGRVQGTLNGEPVLGVWPHRRDTAFADFVVWESALKGIFFDHRTNRRVNFIGWRLPTILDNDYGPSRRGFDYYVAIFNRNIGSQLLACGSAHQPVGKQESKKLENAGRCQYAREPEDVPLFVYGLSLFLFGACSFYGVVYEENRFRGWVLSAIGMGGLFGLATLFIAKRRHLDGCRTVCE